MSNQNKKKKPNLDQEKEESDGKNLLCQDLEQYTTSKKKVHWLKNGEIYFFFSP